MCDYEWLRAMVEAVHLDHVLCIWCWFEKWLQRQNQKIGVAHSELTCVAGNWYLLDVLLMCWGSVTSMWTRRPTWNGFRLLPESAVGRQAALNRAPPTGRFTATKGIQKHIPRRFIATRGGSHWLSNPGSFQVYIHNSYMFNPIFYFWTSPLAWWNAIFVGF